MFKPFLVLDASIGDSDFTSRVAVSLDDICFVTLERAESAPAKNASHIRILSLAHGMLFDTLDAEETREAVTLLTAKTDEGRLASLGYLASSGNGLWINPETLVGLSGDVAKPTPIAGVDLSFRGRGGLAQDHRFRHDSHEHANAVFTDLVRILNEAARNRWLARQNAA